jgi:hypothetical protein
MPTHVESGYGFGEAICKARGFVRWGREEDCDAVVCVTMFFIPICPQKTIHTYNWNGGVCDAIPIRWSFMLVFCAMLRRLLYGPLSLGVALLLLFGISLLDRREGIEQMRAVLALVMSPLLAISALGFWFLSHVDQRCRNIRRVLGPHNLGSSDPATWTAETLNATPPSRELFGTASYAEAVCLLLEAREFARAMLAARLTVAVENREKGEDLTDSILQDPNVRRAIEQVRNNPDSWTEVMNSPGSARVLRWQRWSTSNT